MRYSVYQLVDPRDTLPFYVGYTEDMARRYQEHLATASLATSAKEKRILEIKAQGLRPLMEEIEGVEGTMQEAMQRELTWIYTLKEQGIALTNVTSTTNRDRHTLYLDKALISQVDKAFKDAAHELYPLEIEKADYLEAALALALAHQDEIKAMLANTYTMQAG